MAKPLFKASDDDFGGFRVHTTDFVPGIVGLGVAQIYLAPFDLAPGRLGRLDRACPDLLRRRRGGGGSRRRPRTGFSGGGRTHVLEVDFLAEFQAVEGLGGGVRRRRRGRPAGARARDFHLPAIAAAAAATTTVVGVGVGVGV